MMGILYLVLLGLIALDVPDSLLDAFKNISDSLNASKTNVQTGIDQAFTTFEQTKLKTEPERAQKVYEKALEARKLADGLNTYVESIKSKFMEETGGIDDATNDYKGREDMDVSVHMMINQQKYAYELHKRIDATRTGLLNLLSPTERKGVDLSLDAVAPPHRNGFPNKTWEEASFGEGIPMAAAMTALVKIQADTKNSENEVVKKILGRVDVAQVTLDQFKAVVVAPSSYIIAGQQYKAEIYLTAYDQHSNPTITVEGASIPTANGVGNYSVTASGEGKRSIDGTLMVKQVDGPPKAYPIHSEYFVAKPSAVVSPDKMNVLYIGVPNPVTVSAPGVPTSSLKLSMSGGSLSGGSEGHYTAKVSSIGSAKITVMGDKGMVLGTSEFRVKRIPDPKPQFAGKSGGSTGAANLRAQDRLFAKLDNFDFDAKFNVTRFTLLIVKPRQDAIILSGSGNELTSSMRTAMSSVSPGTTIVFKDIVAVGPDGSPRGLDPIVISAN